MVEHALRVVEPQQQRADGARGLAFAVRADHHISGAAVFDLHHHPLAGPVVELGAAGDHPVAAGAFEVLEPALRLRQLRGLRGDEEGAVVLEVLQQPGAPRGGGLGAQIELPQGQAVEGHEAGGGLGGQLVHPRGGRVNAL